jgi:hypothetical protein
MARSYIFCVEGLVRAAPAGMLKIDNVPKGSILKYMTGHARLGSGRYFLLPIFLLFAIGGCGREEERQPTAAEVQAYTKKIDRAEAEAKAKAIRASRAKEKAVEQKHLERVPAQN